MDDVLKYARNIILTYHTRCKIGYFILKILLRYDLISVSATRELALQELLAKMIHEWDNVLFSTMPFKDSGVTILTQLDDIEALLEEHIVKMQAMRGSAFVKPIENEVKLFYDLLLRMQKTIDEWTKVPATQNRDL